MATVYLHIGMPKTGTTAIQNFLCNNREVLNHYGACYPKLGSKYYRTSKVRNAHFLVAAPAGAEQACSYDAPGEEYLPTLDQIAALGQQFDKIILSDEAVWRIRGQQPEFWENLRRDLADRGLELRVIVYLRRQDHFAESVYRQKVKTAYTDLDFHSYLKRLNEIYALDYLPCIEMLEKTLGKDALVIRVYEKEQYHGNLFADFLGVMGIPLGGDFDTSNSEYNISLSGPRLELQRILNTLPENPVMTRLLYDSMYAIQKTSDISTGRDSLFEPGEHTEFLARFEESNRRIAEEHLGRTDGALFRDPEEDGLPTHHVSTEDLLHDAILFYGMAVQNLEKENEKLRQELKTEKETSSANLQAEVRKLRKELIDVRENVLWYRLKRKLKHLSGGGK